MNPVLRAILLITYLIYFCDGAIDKSGSLRSALEAITQREKELNDYDDSEYGYAVEQPEDIAFLNTAANYNPSDYMDDGYYEQNVMNKRISSSFRERVEEDKQKQMEEFAKTLMSTLENNGISGSASDDDYLGELWERYYGNDLDRKDLTKRYFYPPYGFQVGLRKRGRYVEPSPREEPLYSVHHHIPREEDDDYQMNVLRNRYQRANNLRQMSHPYSLKRLPMAKRSYKAKPVGHVHEEKRSIKKQTDPKVEKDLSNIFGAVQIASKKRDLKFEEQKKKKATEDSKKKENKKKDLNKEVVATTVPSGKPLQIKKKSIDWSDYFGLDRRKKSNNGLEKQWLMERYHKAIGENSQKRSAEIPLQNFRNHDEVTNREEKGRRIDDERKLEAIDTKLKNIEDGIVDGALKYTGAHEDEMESKEIQEVKDNVISRLAAAYSLEKMRNAIEEYKHAINNEKERLKQEGKSLDDYVYEEKRTSVPRKEAVDESRENIPEPDNNKCTTDPPKCGQKMFNGPRENLDRYFSGECPIIENACSQVASMIGRYEQVFEGACIMRQKCLLCDNHSSDSPEKRCGAFFYFKAYDSCMEDMDCHNQVSESMRYLEDVNRILSTSPHTTANCDVKCPDIMKY